MFRRLIAPLGTITLLVIVAWALMWAGGPSIAALRDGSATFDVALGAVAAIGAWGLLGWVVLVLIGTALAAVPGAIGRAGNRVVGVITPVAARRTARLALGVAVATGPVAMGTAPAMAHGPSGTAAGPVAAQLFAYADDLPLIERPTRPDQRPQPAAPLGTETHPADSPRQETSEPEPEPEPEPPAQVVVQPGDSLWTIAARHLGPEASDREIAAAWPRWYEANREVIGDNPDLIVPGTALTPPEAP